MKINQDKLAKILVEFEAKRINGAKAQSLITELGSDNDQEILFNNLTNNERLERVTKHLESEGERWGVAVDIYSQLKEDRKLKNFMKRNNLLDE